MTFIACSNSRCTLSRILQILTAVILTGFISSSYAAKGVSFDDPWENINRSIFGFNEWVDNHALKPAAKGYDTVTPKPVQTLVSNFFSNLGELRNAVNSLLQLKPVDTLTAVGRFGLNSTVGMLGLLDVASPLGIEKRYQDFGLTLARWNVPSGPYVMMPLFGPRTVRSGVGIIPDGMVSPKQMVEPVSDRIITNGLDIVNTRAALLSSEDLIVGDRYSFIRDAYLQRRNYIITGELPEDDDF